MDITNKILGYCIAESIDKRLIYRIPYLLLVAIILAPLACKASLPHKLLIMVLAFVILFITTLYLSTQLKSLFERKFFENVNELLSFFDLKKARDIIEKEHSFLDEISIQSKKIVFLGFLNSISSFVFLVMVFEVAVERYYEYTILTIILAISGLFILRDLLKSDIEEINVDESELPIKSILEKYFVQNSLKKLFGTRTVSNIVFKIIYRLFTPMIFVELPKIESKQFLVHITENLTEFLKSLMSDNAKEDKLVLRHINGTPLTQLFVLNERNNCAKIEEDLENKCFEDLFSYMFDSKNKHKRRGWSIVAIYRNTQIVGLMFVQCFKVVKRCAKDDYTPSTALHILIIGSKDVVEFLSLAISMKSVNVKPDEMFSNVKIKHRRSR